jgi:SAM-dependent methyltransferase
VKEYNKRAKCASCNSNSFFDLIEILDLKQVPLAGYFPTKEQLKDKSSYPLKLLFCNNCKLVQTDSVIDPDILFRDYRYMSSVGLSNHFIQVANILNDRYNILGKNILEIGSNDGVLLEPLAKLGANVIGVEPSINISKMAKDKGLDVLNTYFNYDNFKSKEYKNKYDLILSNNTFAHIIDIQSVIKGIKYVLKEGGDFIFEVHHLENLIEEKQWDNIYHEHIFYYSITALNNMFNKYQMTLVDFEEIPIHSGSLRVTVKNSDIGKPSKVSDRIVLESKTIANRFYLEKYGDNVKEHISNFNAKIKQLAKDHIIAGYGASGRANMFCNLTDLNKDVVKFIVDESPERCGRYIANSGIPIVDVDTLKNSDVDLLIIFAWNYSKMIIEKTQFKNFKYLVAFPNLQIVEKYKELEGFESI